MSEVKAEVTEPDVKALIMAAPSGAKNAVRWVAWHLDVTEAAVRQWMKQNTVPTDRVTPLASLLGIKRRDIRPDTFWND